MNTPAQNILKEAEQIVSKTSEQIASLKGLLKGKGEVEDSFMVIQEARQIRELVKKNMSSFLLLVNTPPYIYFNLKMRIQNSQDNTYLRWRDHKMNKMGVQVLNDAMLNPPNSKPENLLQWLKDLTYFETVRLRLNKYMGYLVFLIKQHEEYLDNLNHIQAMLNQAENLIKAS